MICTAKQKQQIDDVLAAFEKCIQEHHHFDIVYSQKVGYLKITLDEDAEEGCYTCLTNLEDLLNTLYNELYNDVQEECGAFHRIDASLRPEELELFHQRVEALLDNLTDHKDVCLDCLDRFLEFME